MAAAELRLMLFTEELPDLAMAATVSSEELEALRPDPLLVATCQAAYRLAWLIQSCVSLVALSNSLELCPWKSEKACPLGSFPERACRVLGRRSVEIVRDTNADPEPQKNYILCNEECQQFLIVAVQLEPDICPAHPFTKQLGQALPNRLSVSH